MKIETKIEVKSEVKNDFLAFVKKQHSTARQMLGNKSLSEKTRQHYADMAFHLGVVIRAYEVIQKEKEQRYGD